MSDLTAPRAQDSGERKRKVPLRPADDPLSIAIFRAFEHTDWDDIEAADGDITSGLARLAAHIAYQELSDV